MDITEKMKCVDILNVYKGNNPYILKLKKNHNIHPYSSFTDFDYEYIAMNADRKPIEINKTVNIPDWYQPYFQKKYLIDFLPEKLFIKYFFGETEKLFHIYGKWRKNMECTDILISKKGVMENFLVEDFHNMKIDFNRYDNLLHLKNPNISLKEHQKDAVKFLLTRKKCILADDMGLGKTMSLSVAAIEGNFDSILIICPASLKTNWKQELMMFVPEKDVTILEGFSKLTKSEMEMKLGYKQGCSNKKVSELKEELKVAGKWQSNRFVIINFDIISDFMDIIRCRSQKSLQTIAEKYPIFDFIKNRKSCIIIDEAHTLSNRTSDRYKLIKSLIKQGCPDCLFLSTGTPITNNPENYFNLLQLIGDPIAEDWDFYMKRYCNASTFPRKGEKEKWTNIFLRIKKKQYNALTDTEKTELKEYIRSNAKMVTVAKGSANLDELRRRTSHIYLRRTKEDVITLPGKEIHLLLYDLTPEMKDEYDRLWVEYEEEQKSINPQKDLNKELIEGAIYRRYCSNKMVDYTKSLVDGFLEKNQKVVIMCCYDEELYTLKDYYGDKSVIYNGKMGIKEKDKAKNEFLQNPDIKVFIGNIDSAGVGLTLISSHVMVFNNMSFVPADNQQAMDRIYRIGQKEKVDIYFQIFKNTQYEYIWNTVLSKQMLIDQVIRTENNKK